MENIVYKIHQIDEISKNIISIIEDKRIILIYGKMGAGKTTLIKALVKALGGIDAGNSPSFGLVNEYQRADGSLLGYHFDFYRIETLEEALDLGFEDYLAQDCWIFIEWPEKIESLLPKDLHKLHLRIEGPEKRQLTLE